MHEHDVLRVLGQQDRFWIEWVHGFLSGGRYWTTTLPVIFG